MLLLRCCAFLQSRVGGEIGGVVQGVRVALQQNVQNQVEPIPMHQQRQQADHVKVLRSRSRRYPSARAARRASHALVREVMICRTCSQICVSIVHLSEAVQCDERAPVLVLR